MYYTSRYSCCFYCCCCGCCSICCICCCCYYSSAISDVVAPANIFHLQVHILPAHHHRSPMLPLHHRLIRWFCGWEEGEKGERHHRQLRQHLEELSSLEQSRTQRAILLVNLVVILAVALAFYVYFSISPFTEEEIDRMREQEFDRRSMRLP